MELSISYCVVFGQCDASDTVLNGPSDGWLEWKDKEGKSINYYRGLMESEE